MELLDLEVSSTANVQREDLWGKPLGDVSVPELMAVSASDPHAVAPRQHHMDRFRPEEELVDTTENFL